MTPALQRCHDSVLCDAGCGLWDSSLPLCSVGEEDFPFITSEFSFQKHSLYPSSFGWQIEQRFFLFSLHQFITEINPIMRKLIHNLDMYSWWFLIKFTLTSFLSSTNSRISFFISVTKVRASYQSTSKGPSSTISFLLHVTNIWQISKLN